MDLSVCRRAMNAAEMAPSCWMAPVIRILYLQIPVPSGVVVLLPFCGAAGAC